ncbi:flagellar motor switch protein FliN [Methylomonas montana]|uniref:flagellar motor switch protein FliN n=1 Tax=Methylomonas montana TaxID=3058963 RepID=UPI00265982CA|nr:flagellar motor switch protein FliN [Methylomonas montana]WKJ91060.1 flagellar motor switch protein FliN [Methylomonas montana]
MSENDEIGDDWAAAMNEQASAEADWGEALKEQASAAKNNSQGFATAEFPEFDEHKSKNSGPSGDEVKLDVILDVPVTVSLEIGRTKINIRNLLQLNQGSVVELDRFAGEPMDVLVNGTLVAHGEVVVVNDKFGIRLTDIISPSERVRKLG